MPMIYIPSRAPSDWRCLLADPEKHWVIGRSARTLAHAWEDADGFPSEIRRILSQDKILAQAEPLLIFPEWKVGLPGGGHASQNDLWLLAKSGSDLISMTVEGKTEESFDKTVGEWKVDASSGKRERLDYLTTLLGFRRPVPDGIRYQFLHRAAAAVIEAERFGARHAVMAVHSFSKSDTGVPDFTEFVKLFGTTASVDKLAKVTVSNNRPLYLAWVRGDRRYTQM